MTCFDVIYIYVFFFILSGVRSTAGTCRLVILIGFRNFPVVSPSTLSTSLSLCARCPSASHGCSDQGTITSLVTAPRVAETVKVSPSLETLGAVASGSPPLAPSCLEVAWGPLPSHGPDTTHRSCLAATDRAPS